MTRLRDPRWLLALLVGLVPVHALNLQVGFALKPWFLPLLALPLLLPRRLLARARSAPWPLRFGVTLSLIGAALGAVFGEHTLAGTRHLIALALAYLVALVWIAAPKNLDWIGTAIRVSAIAMAVATLLQSAAFLSTSFIRFLILGAPPLIEPLGYVAYGVIRTVRGLHIDANLSAIHAVVWLFLLLAFPSSRFSRRADSAVAGLLVAQVVLAFSRSGVLALLLGAVTLGAATWITRQPSPRRLALRLAALVTVACLAAVAVVDLTDGRSHLAVGFGQRFLLMETEGGDILAGMRRAGELDATLEAELARQRRPLARAELWARHLVAFQRQPLTGVGHGAGPVRFGGYAHNGVLEAAAGGGVAGLGGYLLLWAGAVLAWWRSRNSPRAAAILAAAAGFALGSAFLTTNYEPLGGLVLGMLYAMPRESRATAGAQPLVTVVTPCLNPGPDLVACLDAVAAQTYPAVEHVVVDGGSTDGTVELLRTREDVRWISERDSGQSQAINKGIAMAHGELVTWLNHDDTLEPDAVAAAVETYLRSRVGWVYGDCRIVEGGREVVWRAPSRLTLDYLATQNRVPQQGAFVTAWALGRVGGLDEKLHLSMDYDLWLRLTAAGIPGSYVPRVLGTFTIHDTSKTGAMPRSSFVEEEALALLKVGLLDEAAAALGRAAAWEGVEDGRVDLERVRNELRPLSLSAAKLNPGLEQRHEIMWAGALTEAAAIEQTRSLRGVRHLLKLAPWRHRVTRRRILGAVRARLLRRP